MTKRKYVGTLKDGDGVIYPRPTTKRTMKNLKTVGVTVTSTAALKLVEQLMSAVNAGAETIDITGYRKDSRITISYK